MVIWEYRKFSILAKLVQATFWPFWPWKWVNHDYPDWESFGCVSPRLFPTGIQLVVGVNKLKMLSELAPLPFPSPVSPVCFECPCYESATQWGQRIIELNLAGRFGRERCGFGTTSSSLGSPAEAIQTRGPTRFYFCISYKQLRLSSLLMLFCESAHDHGWI